MFRRKTTRARARALYIGWLTSSRKAGRHREFEGNKIDALCDKFDMRLRYNALLCGFHDYAADSIPTRHAYVVIDCIRQL